MKEEKKVNEDINYHYIKPKKGTVEYNEHISNNIPRMQRLTKNLNKYIKAYENEKATFPKLLFYN